MKLRKRIRDLLLKSPYFDSLFRRYFWSYIHFPEGEMKFLNSLSKNSIDIAIDVGAAMGSYAWILARKSRVVYCFEPGKVHADYLETAAKGTNITLIKAAVGRNTALVDMYTPAGDDNESRHCATLESSNPIAENSQTVKETVRQVSLDEFFDNSKLNNHSIDILKVDVEGYELPVFEGAIKLIKNHRPLIFCEIEARHNVNYKETFRLLRDLGYSTYIKNNNDFIEFLDENIESLQKDYDLKLRLSENHDPNNNNYINNFIFQHPSSKIKVKK